MLASELDMSDITREYFDDKFDRVSKDIHGIDNRVARIEEKVNNGIVTSEICTLREDRMHSRMKKLEDAQATHSKRLWAVLIAAIGSLISAIIAHVSK